MGEPKTISTPAAETQRALTTYFGRLKHKQQLFTILVLLFICLFFWSIVTVLSSQKTTVVDAELIELAKPLTPVLRTEILEQLKTRRSFTEEELENFPINRIVVDPFTQKERIISTDEVIATPTPRPTPRPTAVPTPVAQ